MGSATEFIVVRKIDSEELSVARIVRGWRPQPEPGFTWGGPYGSWAKAQAAINRKDETLRRQLYPELFRPTGFPFDGEGEKQGDSH